MRWIQYLLILLKPHSSRKASHHQLLWATAQLLVTSLSLIHLVNEFFLFLARTYSRCFMHAIVACMRLSFFQNKNSNLYIFAQIFICPFLPCSWKIAIAKIKLMVLGFYFIGVDAILGVKFENNLMLWVPKFSFLFYEICVQNQWEHKQGFP